MEEREAMEADRSMKGVGRKRLGGVENACVNVCFEEGRSGYSAVKDYSVSGKEH